MGELEKIAAANVAAARDEISAKLRADVNAMHRRHSATGMGGRTIIEGRDLGIAAIIAMRNIIESEFTRVIENGLWSTRAESDEIAGKSRDDLNSIMQVGCEMVVLSVKVARGPEKLVAQMNLDLEAARDTAWTAIDRTLARAVEEKKRRAVKSLPKWLADKLAALFKGG